MDLSKYTIEALAHKASVAADEADSGDAAEGNWAETARQCATAAENKTVEVLKALPLAIEELANYIGGDTEPAEEKGIIRDLCRVGHFDVFNPQSVYGGRPRTMLVDGIRCVI